MGPVLNRPAETLVADVVPDLSEPADDGARSTSAARSPPTR